MAATTYMAEQLLGLVVLVMLSIGSWFLSFATNREGNQALRAQVGWILMWVFGASAGLMGLAILFTGRPR